jgi:hypothetical protein
MLRLVEGTLSVSEYTDNVDVLSYSGKATRIREELNEVCALLSGLQLSSNWKKGQHMAAEREGNEAFFQHVLEVARRFKVCFAHDSFVYQRQPTPSVLCMHVVCALLRLDRGRGAVWR